MVAGVCDERVVWMMGFSGCLAVVNMRGGAWQLWMRLGAWRDRSSLSVDDDFNVWTWYSDIKGRR